MEYNYLEEMTLAVLDFIEENVDLSEYDSRRELERYLNEDAWPADELTGAASESYFCNTWKSAEAVAHNWDLLSEALHELGYAEIGVNPIDKGPCWCDVTIRCYLLPTAIADALDRLDYDFDSNHPDEDDDEEAEEAI